MQLTTSHETITLGGGCFWCLEAAFELLAGVSRVTSGYAGGTTPNPTYYQVCSGTTGHAEVVQVEFDPSTLTLGNILEVFWTIHDPTTLNRQGYDVGSEYRSIILYCNNAQKRVAERSIRAAQQVWPNPIVTEVAPLTSFYPAEAEHQNFYASSSNGRYCQIIINPKLDKLRQRFAARLKTN